MNQNKICPECEVEYMPHIEKCADCGAVLLLHEEHRQEQEAKLQLMTKALENSVVVREGELKWLEELYNVLIDSGIPCTIDSNLGCNKGRCADKCKLIVSKEDLERAEERIAEYYRAIHPELQASHELMCQGKCPACGSPVDANDTECADCGLLLMIIGEEDNGTLD